MRLEPVRVTREDLYDSVWSRPLRTVAATYNVSDVALGKICEKLDVPRPGVGYWARLQHGKAPMRPPLPPARDGLPTYWEFRRSANPGADSPLDDEPDWPDIGIARDLTSPHPLVKRFRAAVEKRARTDAPHRFVAEASLGVVVGKTSVERGLRIADALLRAFDSLEWECQVLPPKKGPDSYGRTTAEPSRTHVRVEGEWICFSIEEKFKQKQTLVGTYGRGGHYEYVWDPQGTLSLKINDLPYGADCRKNWNDTHNQKVESCLSSFLRGLLAAARATRSARQEQERRQREWREAEVRRQEQEQRKKMHEQLVADVEDRIAALRQAQDLRRFAADDRSSGLKENPAWLAWATWYAKTLEDHAHRPLDAPLVDAADRLARWLP